MNTPIVEFIAANIKTTIEGVTTTAGYNQTLTAIRPKRIDYKELPADLTVVIRQMSQEKPAQAVQTAEWFQRFALMAVVIDSDTATTSIDTRLNQVSADIQKALLVDASRGGYAQDTMINSIQTWYDQTGKTTGVAVEITVHYRVVWNDPYTQR